MNEVMLPSCISCICHILWFSQQLYWHHLAVLAYLFPDSVVTHTNQPSYNVSPTSFNFLPSGECYLLPSCPWHPGYCGLRWPLQFLGQRRSHQVEDLRAAWPAHHSLLLQPQRQHLCICFQLRLVEGNTTTFLTSYCIVQSWLSTILFK